MAPADRRRPGCGMTRPLGRRWSGQPEPCWRSAGRHRHRQSRSARTWCSPPPRWHRCSACPGQCNFRFRVHSPVRAPQCSRTARGQGRSTSFFIAQPPTQRGWRRHCGQRQPTRPFARAHQGRRFAPRAGGKTIAAPPISGSWGAAATATAARGGDEDHRNAVSVRTQDLNRRRGAEMAGGVLDHRQRRRQFRHDVFHELRRLLGLGRDRRRLAPRGTTVTQRKARVTRAVAPVTSARTVVWSLRSAMPRAGSSPSGALAFLASNRDPEVRHSLGFPADFAGSETAALVSHLLILLPLGSPTTPAIVPHA